MRQRRSLAISNCDAARRGSWYASARARPVHSEGFQPGSCRVVVAYSRFVFLAAVFLGVVRSNHVGGASSSTATVGETRPPASDSMPNLPPLPPASTTDRLGDHYLMLVNTAMANQMDAPKMAQFDRSPYDGLAVSFADAYDTSPVLSHGADGSANRELEKVHGQGHLAMGLPEPHDRRKRRGRESTTQSPLLSAVSGIGSGRQSRRAE